VISHEFLIPREVGLGRIRYIRDPTTITVDREVLEALKKLRRYRGEPVGEVVRRILKEYLRLRPSLTSY
jgi:hypothetical protein